MVGHAGSFSSCANELQTPYIEAFLLSKISNEAQSPYSAVLQVMSNNVGRIACVRFVKILNE